MTQTRKIHWQNAHNKIYEGADIHKVRPEYVKNYWQDLAAEITRKIMRDAA